MNVLAKAVSYLLLSSISIYALGSKAGIVVKSVATATYIMRNTEHNASSNEDFFVVDELVNLDLSWQDTASVEVGANEKDRVLTMLLTNLSNADETFALVEKDDNKSAFDPPVENVRLYLDSDRNGLFDINKDQINNEVNLTADANISIFIVADIPDSNYSVGDISSHALYANIHKVSTPGSDKIDKLDTVVIKSSDSAVGSYIIRDYWLESNKSATIYSDDNLTHTGSIITYTIDLFIGGKPSGKIIDDVIVKDTIDVGLKYQIDSMTLDSKPLTDKVDHDEGELDDNTTSETVIVRVGRVSDDVHRVVSFDVRVR